TALSRIDEDLGYTAFLRAYRSFLMTGDRDSGRELHTLADRADANLSIFLEPDASAKDRDAAGAIRLAMAPFQRIARYGSGAAERPDALPSSPELERDYAALKAKIAEAVDLTHSERLGVVTRALVLAEAGAVGLLFLLSMVLFAFAWLLRDRLIAPLES